MARALAQIIQELNSVYNPQRDVYNQQIKALPGEQEGELKGLEAAKTDSFGQIVQGANRRGVAFGGIPLAEQASYLGQTYLPAVANLKNRFNQQRFNLRDALAQIAIEQRKQAYGIYGDELARDEAARARAAAARGGGGGGGFGDFGGGYVGGGAPAGQVKGAQTTLRQQWQKEAKAGDWNAQVALNYAGDDGRYDGAVNSQDEYNRLRSMGIRGNYYVAKKSAPSSKDQTNYSKPFYQQFLNSFR